MVEAHESNLMAVAIYLRVSTEEQRERQSILTQREFGERYCQLAQPRCASRLCR